MKYLLRNVFLFSALLTLASCAASGPVGSASTPDTTRRRDATLPAEDLSRYRPVFTPPATATQPVGAKPTVAPTNHVNAKLISACATRLLPTRT